MSSGEIPQTIVVFITQEVARLTKIYIEKNDSNDDECDAHDRAYLKFKIKYPSESCQH